MPRKPIDLDALLGEDSLELTLGGKTYVVKDAPVEFLLEIQRAMESGTAVDARRILQLVLKPLGYSDEDEKQIGTKMMIVASAVIADYFTGVPDRLAEIAPGAARLIPVRQIGPEPSVAS